MKLAIVNDVHFGARSEHELIAREQEKFFSGVFFPYLIGHGIGQILILGDLFDRRKFINFKTLDLSFKCIFRPAMEAGINVDVLVGNHDVFSKHNNTLNSPDLLLRRFPNVRLLPTHEPTELAYGNCWIGFVPWISASDESLQQALKFLATTPCHFIFGHFDIVGFDMGTGCVCEAGLSPDTFSRFQLVLSGHYHNKIHRGNIVYLGTQYEMDWGDYGHDKFFHVFDTETHELHAIKNPFTLHAKLFYRDKLLDPVPVGGKIVKLVVFSKSDIKAYDQAVEALRAQQPESLQIIDASTIEEQAVMVSESESIESIIKRQVSVVEGSDVFKARLDGLMTDLHTEARMLG